MDEALEWVRDVIYDDLHACGCGYFESRLEFLRDTLRDFPLYQSEEIWGKYTEPVAEWFLCFLDGAELIEHGGSLSGSWLTAKGKRLLSLLEDESFFEKAAEL